MKIAKAYAQALYALAKEADQVSAVEESLRQYEHKVHGALEPLFLSPVLTAKAKTQILKKVYQQIQLHPLVQKWLMVVIQKKRLNFLREMIQAYERKIDEETNTLRGQVLCAKTPSLNTQKALESKLAKTLHKSIVLSYKEDSQLMGGFKVQIENLLFDDSLLVHLKKIKEKLKAKELTL